MKESAARQATIYVGLREGVRHHSLREVVSACQDYCDEVGLCVTVAPTTFVYTGGREDGAVVGLINYPRFESSPKELSRHALEIAGRLKALLGQTRVTVVTGGRAVMLEEGD